MRKLIGGAAVLLLVLGLLAGFVLVPVAEAVIADQVAEALGEQLEATVDVDVDVASPAALLRGDVRRIEVQVSDFAVPVDGVDTSVPSLKVVLDDVGVDVARVRAGDLSEVAVGRGVFLTAFDEAAVMALLAPVLARESPDVTLAAVGFTPSSVAVTVIAPDGSSGTVEVRPVPSSPETLLLEVLSQPADGDLAGQVAAQALDGLMVDLPELPLGLVFTGSGSDGEALVLSGTVPPLLDLS